MKDLFSNGNNYNCYYRGNPASTMFDNLFKKLDRQKYPFIDGLYYLFIIVFLLILFLFFA